MGNVWNPAPEDREMTGLLLIKACWGTDVQKERAKGRQLRESRWRCRDLRKLKESLRGRTERFSKGPEPGIWLWCDLSL